jgi:hypothetical protein
MNAMAAEATEVQAEPPSASAVSAPSQPGPQDGSSTQPAAAKGAKAGDDAKAGKKAKSDKGSKRSRSKSDLSTDRPSVAAHPRAARGVARAKGWGGLAGFTLAGYFSLPTGTLAEAALRALIAGCVCYVVAWAGAVFAWRRIVMIEIKGREQQLLLAGSPAGAGETPTSERASARTAS